MLQVIGPNPIRHFYRGGGALFSFRGLEPGPAPEPEDWIASTTSRFNQAPAGLSRLADGSVLAELVAADPLAFLGPEHVAAFGEDAALLVKLIDSAERLIVHAHPDRAFARRHLGCAHGKTEAWVVLSDGEVWVGFSRTVDPGELAEWVEARRVDEMLAALCRLEVRRGDAVLVPAGVPHALGPGVLIVELQEPTDFSICLERRDLADPSLGLDWGVALEAVDRSPWDGERLARLLGPGLGGGGVTGRGRVLPEIADPFFRAELVAGEGAELKPGLAVLVVLAGSGQITASAGTSVAVRAGTTLLLPHAAGPARIGGDAVVLACRPPAPGPLEPARPLV